MESGEKIYTIKFWSSNFDGKHTDITDNKEIAEKIASDFKDRVAVVDLDGDLDEEEEQSPIRITTSG